MKQKRLVCVVEGHGEVQAVPNLCEKIRIHLGVHDWSVDPAPVRQPRARLVDQSRPSPRRGAAQDGLYRAVELARRRPANGVLVLCDQDDDCPAAWGPEARALIAPIVRGTAVMAVREYETWLLYNFPERALRARRITDPERKRDAKKLLQQLCPGYKPSTHQLRLTQGIDIARIRARSDSFDSLVRGLALVFGVSAPPRIDE